MQWIVCLVELQGNCPPPAHVVRIDAEGRINGEGGINANISAQPNACGLYPQAIDGPTCAVSNTGRL